MDFDDIEFELDNDKAGQPSSNLQSNSTKPTPSPPQKQQQKQFPTISTKGSRLKGTEVAQEMQEDDDDEFGLEIDLKAAAQTRN